MSFKNIVIALGAVFLLSIAYGVVRLYYFVQVSGRVVKQSRAYEQNPSSPTMPVLVLGDSTALGTGAKDPVNSVAGRLGKDFPQARIVNWAENGMKTQQLREKLEGYVQEEEYDLVVIHIGANDVLRLNNLDETKRNIYDIITRSLNRAQHVALFTSGNIGEAELIPWFARPLMSRRSKELRDFGVSLQSEFDSVTYVDLYHKEADMRESDFYADDKLHLSDEGYGFWYRELKAALRARTDLY